MVDQGYAAGPAQATWPENPDMETHELTLDVWAGLSGESFSPQFADGSSVPIQTVSGVLQK